MNAVEKEIYMIKKTAFLKGKSGILMIVGLLCIALLSTLLLRDGITKGVNSKINITPYNAEELLKYKTNYVGDNSKVVSLIGNLPYGKYVKGVSLQTKTKPYGITVSYEIKDPEIKKKFLSDDNYRKLYNSAILFALIDNVDAVEFNVVSSSETQTYNRDTVQEHFTDDLREYSKDIERFKAFLQSIVFKVSVMPEKYLLTMSSTPGIQMTAFYLGDIEVKSVLFITQNGSLFTWEVPSGKISEHTQKLEVPLGEAVYWSPIGKGNSMIPNMQDSVITVTLIDKDGKSLAETQVTIRNEEGVYYNVKPSLGVK
jgi:hypothetical protein